jgi:phosphatidylserine/phosphatidylglycerophosphate/cardiolipin synthase-like enzyme
VDYEEVPGSPAPLVTEGHTLGRNNTVDTDDSFMDFYECLTPTPGLENRAHEEQGSNTVPEEEPVVVTSSVLITELYYYTHSKVNNEFVRLCNPTNAPVDVSGWYLTDQPWKEPDDQAKIIIPEHAIFPANTSWYITKNATAFFWETGQLPDFEYAVDSRGDVPQLNTYKTVTLSNTGGLVAVYDDTFHLIDLVIYDDANNFISGWDGPSIASSGSGVILKRMMKNGAPVDTNTASDWMHTRIYGIGQSDFTFQPLTFTGEVTTFVSPDNSYETIVHELQQATHSISLNIYEFTNPFLCEDLISALKRNVSVSIFLEGSPVGGIDDREKYIVKEIAANGGIIRFLVSDEEHQVHARYRFDHAKYLIIDEETVIVESCNWAKTGVPKDPSYGNREWGIVIRNTEVAATFLHVFQDDSNPSRCDSYSLDAMNFSLPTNFFIDTTVDTGSYTPRFTAQTFTGPCTVAPVFSPDNSQQFICDAIDSATTTIDIEQLYIYKDWAETLSPLVEHLINKSTQGVTIKIILDYNTDYTDTIALLNDTKDYLEQYGIQVKFISSDWSPFTTVHNKGMIIDNQTVLISSINWNEQSVTQNREAGILIQNPDIATYYADVFYSDWTLEPQRTTNPVFSWADYKNLILIAIVCGITIALIAHDWRKRKWK